MSKKRSSDQKDINIKKKGLPKFVITSLVGMGVLLAGGFLSFSHDCNGNVKIWNQQIQSSANFDSLAIKQCDK